MEHDAAQYNEAYRRQQAEMLRALQAAEDTGARGIAQGTLAGVAAEVQNHRNNDAVRTAGAGNTGAVRSHDAASAVMGSAHSDSGQSLGALSRVGSARVQHPHAIPNLPLSHNHVYNTRIAAGGVAERQTARPNRVSQGASFTIPDHLRPPPYRRPAAFAPRSAPTIHTNTEQIALAERMHRALDHPATACFAGGQLRIVIMDAATGQSRRCWPPHAVVQDEEEDEGEDEETDLSDVDESDSGISPLASVDEARLPPVWYCEDPVDSGRPFQRVTKEQAKAWGLMTLFLPDKSFVGYVRTRSFESLENLLLVYAEMWGGDFDDFKRFILRQKTAAFPIEREYQIQLVRFDPSHLELDGDEAMLRLLRQHQGLCCDADKWIQQDYNMFVPGPPEEFAAQLETLEFKFGQQALPHLLGRSTADRERVVEYRAVQEDGRILVTEIRVPTDPSPEASRDANANEQVETHERQIIIHQPFRNSFRAPYMNIAPRVDPADVEYLERDLQERRATTAEQPPAGQDYGEYEDDTDLDLSSSGSTHDGDDSSEDEDSYGPDVPYQIRDDEPEETWRPTLLEIRAQRLFGGMIRAQELRLQEAYETLVAQYPEADVPLPTRERAVQLAEDLLLANALVSGCRPSRAFQADTEAAARDPSGQNQRASDADIAAAVRGAQNLVYAPNIAMFGPEELLPNISSFGRGGDDHIVDGCHEPMAGEAASKSPTSPVAPNAAQTLHTVTGMFGAMSTVFDAASDHAKPVGFNLEQANNHNQNTQRPIVPLALDGTRSVSASGLPSNSHAGPQRLETAERTGTSNTIRNTRSATPMTPVLQPPAQSAVFRGLSTSPPHPFSAAASTFRPSAPVMTGTSTTIGSRESGFSLRTSNTSTTELSGGPVAKTTVTPSSPVTNSSERQVSLDSEGLPLFSGVAFRAAQQPEVPHHVESAGIARPDPRMASKKVGGRRVGGRRHGRSTRAVSPAARGPAETYVKSKQQSACRFDRLNGALPYVDLSGIDRMAAGDGLDGWARFACP